MFYVRVCVCAFTYKTYVLCVYVHILFLVKCIGNFSLEQITNTAHQKLLK